MSRIPAHPIHVLVLHGDPLLRAGLSAAAADHVDFTVLKLSDLPLDGEVGILRESTVDVVISDFRRSISVLSARPSDPNREAEAAVIVVANEAREGDIREAFAHGVRGYLTSDCTFDELAAAIRSVHRGGRYLCARAGAVIAEGLTIERLTPRESEVLQLLAEGCPNKSIARRLSISVGTVKTHMRGIMSKLDVGCRTQAVVAAEKRGLVTRDRETAQGLELWSAALPAARTSSAGLLKRISTNDWTLPAPETV